MAADDHGPLWLPYNRTPRTAMSDSEAEGRPGLARAPAGSATEYPQIRCWCAWRMEGARSVLCHKCGAKACRRCPPVDSGMIDWRRRQEHRNAIPVADVALDFPLAAMIPRDKCQPLRGGFEPAGEVAKPPQPLFRSDLRSIRGRLLVRSSSPGRDPLKLDCSGNCRPS